MFKWILQCCFIKRVISHYEQSHRPQGILAALEGKPFKLGDKSFELSNGRSGVCAIYFHSIFLSSYRNPVISFATRHLGNLGTTSVQMLANVAKRMTY